MKKNYKKIINDKYNKELLLAEESNYIKLHVRYSENLLRKRLSKKDDIIIIVDEQEKGILVEAKKGIDSYLVNKPCISLDCGFWIDELDGFPRAFVNFVLDTIGIRCILKLMEGKENRSCRFTECLSYYDGKELNQFWGKQDGTLSYEILGNDTDKKWSDLWYIYKPSGYDKTLAQMTDEERANREKYDSIDSMREFSKWFNKQK